MTVVKWVVGIAGAVLVVADLYDLVRALVVPRPHTIGAGGGGVARGPQHPAGR